MKPDKDILSRVFPGVPDSARRTLVIIMLIGLALRLMAAYLQPAFYDEGHTYNFTKCGFSAIITEMLRDSHPPTYNLLIYPLVQLSDSIFVLRLPGVLAGTLAIFFGFMLGKRLGGECCGLLTAAVMAGVYNLWLLDAQLRSYGLLDCALLALLLMVIKIYETGRPISLLVKPSVNWAVFTLTAILAASLHATGTLAVLCYLILLAILPVREEMPSRRLPCALLGAALLPPLGWGLYVKAQASSYLSQAHALGSNLREFLDLPAYLLGWQVYPRYIFDLQQYLHGIHSGAEDLVTWLARNINPIYGLAILLGWWLLIWGIGLAWQSQSQRAIIALTPPLALAAMLITANALHIQVLQKRHLLPLCPALLAFICLQIVAINSSTIRRLLTALLLGSCALTAILFPFNTRLWNQHWQGAIDFIEQRCDAHTMILVYHSGAFYSFAHAYAPGQIIYNPQTGKISVDKNYSGPLIVPLTKNTANPNFLRDIKGYRLFIVLNQYQYENAKDHLFDWICQNFDLGQAYHEDSYTDWAVVDVAELTPKLNE